MTTKRVRGDKIERAYLWDWKETEGWIEDCTYLGTDTDGRYIVQKIYYIEPENVTFLAPQFPDTIINEGGISI